MLVRNGQESDVTAPKILVVGSINCDITTYLEQFPQAGETVMGSRSAVTLGGKGLNQAIAAARVGARVQILACVGRDSFGAMARDYLIANGIATDLLLITDEASTGTASILVDARARNMVAVAPGANRLLTPGDVSAAESAIAAVEVLIVQMELPFETVKAALMLAAKHGVLTVLNPAPALGRVLELLPYVTVVTPNETELELITGASSTNEASLITGLNCLRNAGANLAVVTRGERGCSYVGADVQGFMSAFNVTAVDPTGAGDVFNGVLAVSLAAEQKKWKDKQRMLSHSGHFSEVHLRWAICRASAAAAISVTRPLAQNAAPYMDEIEALIAAQPRALDGKFTTPATKFSDNTGFLAG